MVLKKVKSPVKPKVLTLYMEIGVSIQLTFFSESFFFCSLFFFQIIKVEGLMNRVIGKKYV